jgi:hypothetical protein
VGRGLPDVRMAGRGEAMGVHAPSLHRATGVGRGPAGIGSRQRPRARL